MKAKGFTDYGSNVSSVHPFYLRCHKLHQRSMQYLKNKNRIWMRLTTFFISILFLNILIIFWLFHIRVPIVFVDTLLNSGRIYEHGILMSSPLNEQQSIKKLSAYKKMHPTRPQRN